MSLYQLANDFEKVMNGSLVVDEDTGEVIFNQDDLESLDMEFHQKLENCAMFVKNEKAKSNAISDEIKHLYERKKAIDGRINRTCEYITKCMSIAGESELETPRARIKFRKSTAVNVLNQELIPESYLISETIEKVDKASIKRALNLGETVPGCELEHRNNLQVD